MGVGFPTFFGRDFLLSIHYNQWIPRYLVGSLPINIESKHEALGPSLARGKSEVSQLCAGVSARRTSLNSDRQGSLNAPSPKPWGLNIAGSFQTIKPFKFLLFIFSNQQLLNCFAQILFPIISHCHCATNPWFSRRSIGSARGCSTNCQERRQVFPQIKTIWDSITEITRPTVSSFNNLPFAKAWYQPPLFTFFSSPFLSAEPSRHHEMQSPRLLANL